MTIKRTIILLCLLSLTVGAWAQKTKKENNSKEKKEKTSTPPAKKAEATNYKATPMSMWEVGAHGGYIYLGGDIYSKTGYGGGIHIRKSIDYLMSIRFDALYATFEGQDRFLRSFENNWLSGTGFAIFSLNSFRFNKPIRPFNLYAGAGVGANYFEVNGFDLPLDTSRINPIKIEREISYHGAALAGISIRLGKRFNISAEHQIMLMVGPRADLIDGVQRVEGISTPNSDLFNYTSIRLNFNIGSASKNSEPLYWVNPLEFVLNDLSEVKKKQDVALKDSDADGVIDAIDQEPNTPPDVEVDTKGRVLDSDRDGVPNYKDKEPYNPPRSGEMVNNEGIIEVTNPAERPGGGGGVSETRVREIVQEELEKYNLTEGAAGVADWFLPMIHFGTSSYAIKFSDYGTLAGIARMLKSNGKLRLVVTGFTDQTGPQENNELLSYQRAKSVVDHFVNSHGISADRLVLQYKGQEEALVPSSASYMNRRVEFRVATGEDVGMDPPSGESKKKEGY